MRSEPDKELTARAVHILRHGSGKKLVAINCAAMTANLLESELFGQVKGAFTSAHHEKTGLLELAETGSIFLDEISEVPIDLQTRLLRVVQEKTFRKVGGVKDIKCKATIIDPDEFEIASCRPVLSGLKEFSLESAERELIAKAMAEAGWQKTRAAALLGITRAILYAKVKQYNIHAPKRRQTVAAT